MVHRATGLRKQQDRPARLFHVSFTPFAHSYHKGSMSMWVSSRGSRSTPGVDSKTHQHKMAEGHSQESATAQLHIHTCAAKGFRQIGGKREGTGTRHCCSKDMGVTRWNAFKAILKRDSNHEADVCQRSSPCSLGVREGA